MAYITYEICHDRRGNFFPGVVIFFRKQFKNLYSSATVKKCDQLAPRFGTCVLDPYNSTHTIITATTKKCFSLV